MARNPKDETLPEAHFRSHKMEDGREIEVVDVEMGAERLTTFPADELSAEYVDDDGVPLTYGEVFADAYKKAFGKAFKVTDAIKAAKAMRAPQVKSPNTELSADKLRALHNEADGLPSPEQMRADAEAAKAKALAKKAAR